MKTEEDFILSEKSPWNKNSVGIVLYILILAITFGVGVFLGTLGIWL